MRKALTLLLLTLTLGLFTAGCMTLGARRYMEACLKAGYNEGECEMRALEIDRENKREIGRSLQETGRSLQDMSRPRPPSLSCTTTYFGNMATTNCH